MRIVTAETDPIRVIPYLVSGSSRVWQQAEVPILKVVVDALPSGLDALVATSDLQGHSLDLSQLVGVTVAQELPKVLLEHDADPSRTGILLCGDFYARSEKAQKGGQGNVSQVWAAFHGHFKWVVGVAGNHDLFSAAPSVPAFHQFKKTCGVGFLDGQTVYLDELRITGISGVIGNAARPFRRNDAAYIDAVRAAAQTQPDIMLLHEAPAMCDEEGSVYVSEAIKQVRDVLIICGHKHWRTPVHERGDGLQVVNVNERVIVMTPAVTSH